MERKFISTLMEDLSIKKDEAPDEERLDIMEELDLLNRIRELGFDTSQLEELLFKDINIYNKEKSKLMGRIEEEGIGINEKKDIEPEEELDIEIDLTDNEEEDVLFPEQEDILLIGKPLSSQSSEGQIKVEKDVDVDIGELPVTASEKPYEKKINENENNENIFENEEFEEESIDLSEKIDDEISDKDHLENKKNNENIFNGKKDPYLKRRKWRTILIIFIGIILVTASAYLFYQGTDNEESSNEDIPSPSIMISDLNPFPASPVSLGTSGISDRDYNIEWSIDPKTFKVLEGDLRSDEVILYFRSSGEYNINLKIGFKSESRSSSEIINVRDRDITIEREKFGDEAEYKVNGHVFIDDLNKLISGQEISSIRSLDADFWTESGNPMVQTIIDSPGSSKDGFGQEITSITKNTVQFLRLSGQLHLFDGGISPVTGTIDFDQNTFIDAYLKKPSFMLTSTETDLSFPISSTTFSYNIKEDMLVYPDLQQSYRDLNLEDISPGRNISQGDEGITQWGTYDLLWKTGNYEIIDKWETLSIDLEMDQKTMDNIGLDSFSLKLWVTDDIPIAVRMIMNISSNGEVANPYDIDYCQTLSSFQVGINPIIYGASDYQHSNKNRIDRVNSDFEGQFHDNWTYLPELGSMSTSIPQDFGPENALSSFENDAAFKEFLRGKDDPFGIYSNYSHFKDSNQWKISIAEQGDRFGWNQTIRKEGLDQGFPARVMPVGVSRNNIGEVITFSGAETSLKNLLSELDHETSERLYGSREPENRDELDLSLVSLGTKADHPYPMVGIINPSLVERIPLCFVIESFDGSMEVGLNMKNGQLSYVHNVRIDSD